MVTDSSPIQRVVIVGGGFGGRYAAARLARRLPSAVEITLVDRNEAMVYTPLLTEVAGRSVSPKNIVARLDEVSRRVVFVRSEVISADLSAKTLLLADGRVIGGSHLLFALGSDTNYRGVQGARENSLTMKTLADARSVREIAERNVASASYERDPVERRRLLTFVVAGGGYTGVETAAAINDLVSDAAGQRGMSLADLRVVLVESTKRRMAEMPESLGEYGCRRLKQDKIEVLLNVGVDCVEPHVVHLTNGDSFPFGMLVWDTGIVPNGLVASLPFPKGKRGGIVVDGSMRVRGLEGVWAIGDCAEIPKPDASGATFEPTAQNATRQGVAVANNILADLQGRSTQPFRYKQIGELAIVARRSGVAYVFGVKVSGFLGWVLWRGVYIVKMPGLGSKVGIFLDWVRLAFDRKYVSTT